MELCAKAKAACTLATRPTKPRGVRNPSDKGETYESQTAHDHHNRRSRVEPRADGARGGGAACHFREDAVDGHYDAGMPEPLPGNDRLHRSTDKEDGRG